MVEQSPHFTDDETEAQRSSLAKAAGEFVVEQALNQASGPTILFLISTTLAPRVLAATRYVAA